MCGKGMWHWRGTYGAVGGKGRTSERLTGLVWPSVTSSLATPPVPPPPPITRQTTSTVLSQNFFSLQQNIQTRPASSLRGDRASQLFPPASTALPHSLSLFLVLHESESTLRTRLLSPVFFRPMTVLSLIAAVPERETGTIF